MASSNFGTVISPWSSYQLFDKIGAGAMGEVWSARHRLLKRRAAVKLIRPDSLQGGGAAAAKAIARFEQEAHVTADLQSPHSVDLYDFGTADDGTFYYVMELLEGFDLDGLVRDHGPQPSERVAHILRQACHSLADAHDRGLIHRDVKPANLFVCRMGQDLDFVKVLDFGLVTGGEFERGDEYATRDGAVVGTPAFMAPEMYRRDQPIDGRADLYSLGCVGYWLLSGRLVFSAPTAAEILVRHLNDEPVPPSRSGVPGVDPELERIVMRCLRKNVEDRPPTASSLGEDLTASGLADAWSSELRREWWDRA